MKCPNKNLEEWKRLVNSQGEELAYYLWDRYKGAIIDQSISPEIIQRLEAFQLYEDQDKLCPSGICNYTSRKATQTLEEVGLNPYPNVTGSSLHVIVNSPLGDFPIIHYVAATAIGRQIYIYDMPQNEFISNEFYGRLSDVKLKTTFRPRLIPLTSDEIMANYNLSYTDALKFIRDVINNRGSNLAPPFSEYIKNNIIDGEEYIQDLKREIEKEGLAEYAYIEYDRKYEKVKETREAIKNLVFNEPLSEQEKEKVEKLVETKLKFRTREYVPRTKSEFLLSNLIYNILGRTSFSYDYTDGLDVVLQKFKDYVSSQRFLDDIWNNYTRSKEGLDEINRIISLAYQDRQLMLGFLKKAKTNGWDKAFEDYSANQKYTIRTLLPTNILEKYKSETQRIFLLTKKFEDINNLIELPMQLGRIKDNTKINILIEARFKRAKQYQKAKTIIDFLKLSDFDTEYLTSLVENEARRQYSFFQEKGQTYFQTLPSTISKASPSTIAKVKQVAEKMGIKIQSLADYVKGNPNIDAKGVNALADLLRGIIAIAEGKEDVGLTEEFVHIATATFEQTNPKLITEMISKIDRFKIYKRTFNEYKDVYKLSDGKPDIRKIKKEAVDKLIVELIIYKNEGDTEFPELRDETFRSMIRGWWQSIIDWIRHTYRKANIDIFEEAAEKIMKGEAAIPVKEGVSELFESNPELANAVYETIFGKTQKSNVNSEAIELLKDKIKSLRTEDGSIPDNKLNEFKSLRKQIQFLESNTLNNINKALQEFITENKLSESDAKYFKKLATIRDNFQELVEDFNEAKGTNYTTTELMTFFDKDFNLQESIKNESASNQEKNQQYEKNLLENNGFEANKDYTANELDEFVQEHGSKQVKIIWNLIKAVAQKLGVTTRFMLDGTHNIPENAAGHYFGGKIENRANLFSTPQSAARIIVHELVHGVTTYILKAVEQNNTKVLSKLTDRQLKAVEKLNKLFEELKKDKDFDDTYGTKNTHELLAELTNESFTDKLKSKNIFEKILEAIFEIFNIPFNAYNESIKILEDLISNPIVENRYEGSQEENFSLYAENVNQITPQQKQQAQELYAKYLESLNKLNTNPILQNNQQEQVKKFVELQERLNNKEFLKGAKNAYESSKGLQELGTQEQYNDYIARVSLGILKNPSSGEYNYESKVKDIVYHGTDAQFDKFDISLSGKKTSWAKHLPGIYFFFNKSATEGYDKSVIEQGRFDLWQKMWEGYEKEYIRKAFPDVFEAFENRKEKTEYDYIDEWGAEYLYDQIKEGRIISAITNIKSPLNYEAKYKRLLNETPKIKQKLTKDNDGIIVEGILDRLNDDIGFMENVLIVLDPEQIHILGSKQDVEGFRKFVEGRKGEVFYQLEPSTKQKDLRDKILRTREIVRKQESTEPIDKHLMDTDEASNWYELFENGQWRTIKRRVTDRVKAWYRQHFSREFTAQEKEINEIKRKFGIKAHKYFEEIYKRYFDENTGMKKDVVDERPSFKDPVDEEVYIKLEEYFSELMNKFTEEGKSPMVFSEVIVFDPKADKGKGEAGTLDLLIIEEDGKAHIFDWKFMAISDFSDDVPWYKQGAFDLQLGRYRDILEDTYGIKHFGMNMAVPFLLKVEKEYADDKKHYTIDITGITTGSVDRSKITNLKLAPVAEKRYRTGYEKLDELISILSGLYEQASKKKVTTDEKKEAKRERMNIIHRAIRSAQVLENIAPLIETVAVIRKEGQMILDDYNMLYKDKKASDPSLNKKDLSEFAGNLKEYMDVADVFSQIDILIGEYIYKPGDEEKALTSEEKEEILQHKEVLENLRKERLEIEIIGKEIERTSKEFIDKFVGIRNLVSGILSPEAIVKGLGSWFKGVSEIPLASLRILYKLVSDAKGMASEDALKEVDRLMEIRTKLAARGENLRDIVKKVYQKDKEGDIVNKLIHRYSKQFFDEMQDNAKEGNRSVKWINDNIDVNAYMEEAMKLMDGKISYYEKIYSDNPELLETLISQEIQKWDITKPGFNGFNNYVIARHPLPKWESEEYKEIKKDEDLFALYEFITEMNQKAKEAGYLENRVASTFLPFVRKTMAESLAWDLSGSAITNWMKTLQLRAGDVGYGKINSLTGEIENGIPKYYTEDFTQLETGESDFSDVSEDLFKNLILYITHMEKYKYLSEIEEQLLLVKKMESLKGHLSTSRTGNLVLEEGRAVEEKGNVDNARMFEQFLNALLYGQKYPLSDTDIGIKFAEAVNWGKKAINKLAGKTVLPLTDETSMISLTKTVDATNRAMQLKTLGFEFISGAVNAFGGNIQVATQAGTYFKAREFAANQFKLIGNKFRNDDERKMFIQLMDLFMPLKDDPTYEKLKKAGMSPLTRGSITDTLMMFMRDPEEHIEKSIFLTLLQNMMVEDGKIISIREYVNNKHKGKYSSSSVFRDSAREIENEIKELQKTRSIYATKQLEDGKLVIPGLNLENREEIQRLTNLTRRISRNATGGISDNDLNKMNMNLWLKSIMVFKNWIPKLMETRFGEFRRVADDFSLEIDDDGHTLGEKYDVGRIRLFSSFIHINIMKTAKEIIDVLSVNENGVLKLDTLFEKYSEQYYRKTGKQLNMSREDFNDLIRNNLRNQLKELGILFSLLGMMLAMGFIAPDDDDSKAEKNLYRYSQRVVDKFISELSFFYNPAEFRKLLSGSMFPAMGLVTDASRFANHLMMQVTGFDMSNPMLPEDKVRKKAQPIKNAAKMFPFTKSLVTYGAIFSSEFADEFDVTIQKETRR